MSEEKMQSRTLINEERLMENLEKWARGYPKEAVFLPFHDDEDIYFCETEKQELNLKNAAGYHYHAETGAREEAEKWFRSQNLESIETVFIFGVGLGYYYEAAKEWLHEDDERTLVFLEDSLAVINRLLQTEIGTDILNDPQARVHYFAGMDDEDHSFVYFFWDYLMNQVEVTALNSYRVNRSEFYEDFKHKLIYDLSVKNAAVDEYVKFGYCFLINFFPNLLTLANSYRATDLFGQFKNVPAIICGAGPSLKKNIDQVAKCKDKAIVIAGGSAMNALNSRQIQPHFGVGIDPNPTQVERIKNNTAEGVPFFYRNRMHKDAYRLIRGPRLYVPNAGGYEIAEWFDKKFGLHTDEWLDEGYNVVNFSIELARAMGCNPIILVGVDLAFTDQQTYADGIIDENAFVAEKEQDDIPFIKKDIYGNPIYTVWKWVAESKWTGDYLKEHPEVNLINATEGGIGMPGVANQDFSEVEKQYLNHDYPLEEKIAKIISNSAITNITPEEVKDAVLELREGFVRCMDHLSILMEDNESYKKQVEENQSVPEYKQSGLAALAETELAEEPAYTEHISTFNEVVSRLLSKRLSKLRHSRKEEWEQARDKCELTAMKLKFLSDSAKAAISAIDLALSGPPSSKG